MGPANKPVMTAMKRECGMLGASCESCRWAVGWSQSKEFAACVQNPVHMNTHKDHFCAQYKKKTGG